MYGSSEMINEKRVGMQNRRWEIRRCVKTREAHASECSNNAAVGDRNEAPGTLGAGATLKHSWKTTDHKRYTVSVWNSRWKRESLSSMVPTEKLM